MHMHTLVCSQPSLGPTVDQLHVLFGSFGEVAKIVVSEPPRGGLQVRGQLTSWLAARHAWE